MILVNFMPLDHRHPVALAELLRSNLEEWPPGGGRGRPALRCPSPPQTLYAVLPEGSFVTADDSFGFVYANDTAAACVLVGEARPPP